MIRQCAWKYLSLLGVFFLAVFSASFSLAEPNVTLVDFESLRVVDSNTNHTVGDSYSEDGMTLNAVQKG
jgi:hypothetical protein